MTWIGCLAASKSRADLGHHFSGSKFVLAEANITKRASRSRLTPFETGGPSAAEAAEHGDYVQALRILGSVAHLKRAQPNADSERESVKFGRACITSIIERSQQCRKPTKRKRASAPVTDAASAHPADARYRRSRRSESLRPARRPAEFESAAMSCGRGRCHAEVIGKRPTIGLTSNCTVKDAAALKE